MTDYPDSDRDLWGAFRQGDEQAFARIYNGYVKILYRYGVKITSDTPLIEDCIQDLFIELWNSRTRLGDTDSIKFYLFRVMRRKLYQRLTSQSVAISDALALTHPLTVESYESTLITDQETASQKERLHLALSILPGRQREAVNLRYFHGFSYEQIAALMDITLQSVHNTIQKAMKQLRAHLGPFIVPVIIGITQFFL